MRGRSVTAWGVGVGLLMSASANLRAQAGQPDLATMMRSQILDIWLSRAPDGARILIDPPSNDELPTRSPFTIVTQIEQQIGSQLSSLPLGSSSGGFTYSYDPALGTFRRSTQTFGPAFAERAQTLGRGRFNVGASYQHNRYSHLDGSSLQGGITFVLPPGTITNPNFANVIEANIDLTLTSDTTVFYAAAGLASRVDIGVAVPYQRVAMDLTSHATIRDFSTQAISPPSRVFPNGTKTQDFTSSGRAAGIGDVVLRGKYKLTRPGLREMAVTVDLRLPTGDADNMLGTGTTEAQVMLVTSYSASRVDPHFNIGYTFANKDATDQLNYVAGVEAGVTERLTVIGDIIGRNFLETLQLAPSRVTIRSPGDPARGLPPVTSAIFETVEPQTGTLRSILGTVGVKFNPTRSILVSAHLVATMTDSGLRRRLAPVIGFDYSF